MKRVTLLSLVLFFAYAGNCLIAQSYVMLIKEAKDKYTAGQFATSAELYEKALALNGTNASVFYDAGCAFALAGNKTKAIQFVQQSINKGFENISKIYSDEDLLSLRNDTTWNLMLGSALEKKGLHETEIAWRSKLFYRATYSYMLGGNYEKAFDNLEMAIENGWSLIEETTDLNNLKNDSRWAKTLEKFKRQSDIGSRAYFWGMYLGILFILFVYNLLLYFSLKDISFLYYAIMIFAYSQFEVLRTEEFAFYSRHIFVWQNYYQLMGRAFYFIISFCCLLHLIFTRQFLQLPKSSPKLNTWMNWFIIYFILQTLVSVFFKTNIKLFVYYSGMFSFMFTFTVAVLCWKKGFRSARFFVFASVSSTLGLAIRVLHSLHIIDFDIGLSVFGSDTLGMIIFFCLLSLALGDRMNILKQEKEQAQEKALEVLEEKVRERTAEVQHQKNEIEEKQKEIIDSIKYAQRIQKALITNEKYIEKEIDKLTKR